MTKEEKKAKVLNAFFASVSNSKGSCSPDTQASKQEEMDGEKKETPKSQGKRVSDLLRRIDMHRSMGLDGIHQRTL